MTSSRIFVLLHNHVQIHLTCCECGRLLDFISLFTPALTRFFAHFYDRLRSRYVNFLNNIFCDLRSFPLPGRTTQSQTRSRFLRIRPLFPSHHSQLATANFDKIAALKQHQVHCQRLRFHFKSDCSFLLKLLACVLFMLTLFPPPAAVV